MSDPEIPDEAAQAVGRVLLTFVDRLAVWDDEPKRIRAAYEREGRAVLAAALPALRQQWAERVLKVIGASHGGVHWCFDAAGQDVVFEPGTQWWPCPTLDAALREFGEGT